MRSSSSLFRNPVSSHLLGVVQDLNELGWKYF
jgi:hypothetical protein